MRIGGELRQERQFSGHLRQLAVQGVDRIAVRPAGKAVMVFVVRTAKRCVAVVVGLCAVGHVFIGFQQLGAVVPVHGEGLELPLGIQGGILAAVRDFRQVRVDFSRAVRLCAPVQEVIMLPGKLVGGKGCGALPGEDQIIHLALALARVKVDPSRTHEVRHRGAGSLRLGKEEGKLPARFDAEVSGLIRSVGFHGDFPAVRVQDRVAVRVQKPQIHHVDFVHQAVVLDCSGDSDGTVLVGLLCHRKQGDVFLPQIEQRRARCPADVVFRIGVRKPDRFGLPGGVVCLNPDSRADQDSFLGHLAAAIFRIILRHVGGHVHGKVGRVAALVERGDLRSAQLNLLSLDRAGAVGIREEANLHHSVLVNRNAAEIIAVHLDFPQAVVRVVDDHVGNANVRLGEVQAEEIGLDLRAVGEGCPHIEIRHVRNRIRNGYLCVDPHVFAGLQRDVRVLPGAGRFAGPGEQLQPGDGLRAGIGHGKLYRDRVAGKDLVAVKGDLLNHQAVLVRCRCGIDDGFLLREGQGYGFADFVAVLVHTGDRDGHGLAVFVQNEFHLILIFRCQGDCPQAGLRHDGAEAINRGVAGQSCGLAVRDGQSQAVAAVCVLHQLHRHQSVGLSGTLLLRDSSLGPDN